jgi:Inosine-uridine nucleoside N-ribohydrolase
MENKKVILDTDIGSDIDDAFALAYLLKEPRCELVGITTVSGEANRRAEMCSAMCQHARRDDIPIHVGCDRAMLIDIPQKKAQQAEGGIKWAHREFAADNTAIEFLRKTIRANPGEITLLAIGPMTNVGVLFATDPEIPALLKEVVLMCGMFFMTGGEWNAFNDPHATAITYGNSFHAKPPRHVSYGIDVTCKCMWAADECRKRFQDISVLAPVRDFAEVWFKHASHVTFHDPLAAVSLFNPDICGYEDGNVNISLAAPTLGWTVFNKKDGGPHTVARTVDTQRFFETYLDVVRS